MKLHNDKISWALILSATSSLVLMICLLQIDSIVRNTLYSYGLRFSPRWASPYLTLTQIGFAAGWINIVIAFVVQIYNVRMKEETRQPLAAIEKARETAEMPEPAKGSEEALKEHEETKTAKSPEEAPAMASESEAQEKREEPQEPEQAPEPKPQEQEQTPESQPQEPETKPEETPSLVDLFH